MAKRALLDIDPSIIERNLMTVAQDDDFKLDTLLPKKEDNTPTKMIRPTPGFCIKAKTQDDNKIFVNVCQTDDIPPPEDISEGQLIEILSSETCSEFRVPMSIGEGRPVNDKSGNLAMAYDIAINTNFYNKMESCEVFKQFFLNVVFEGLENKFNIKINMENFCILKNRNVMGNLQLHCIKDKEMMKKMGIDKKLIEIVEPNTTKKIPKYRVVKDIFNDKEHIFVDIFMPDLISMKNIDVQLNEERLIVETEKPHYFLDIFFPVFVKFKESISEFNKTNGFLTVKMPVA